MIATTVALADYFLPSLDDVQVLSGPQQPEAIVKARRDAEAAREIEVLAAILVPDAAPLGPRPDHEEPLRPGSRRLTVSAASL